MMPWPRLQGKESKNLIHDIDPVASVLKFATQNGGEAAVNFLKGALENQFCGQGQKNQTVQVDGIARHKVLWDALAQTAMKRSNKKKPFLKLATPC